MPIDEAAQISGMHVRSSDGHDLGRVSTVHVSHDELRPLLVQIDAHEPVEPLVPVVDATIEQGELVIPYGQQQVMQGPAVTGRRSLTLAHVVVAIEQYEVGQVEVTGRDLGETAAGFGDVDAGDPDVEKLPPVVIVRPAIRAQAAEDGTDG
jgi:hypothetical protein